MTEVDRRIYERMTFETFLPSLSLTAMEQALALAIEAAGGVKALGHMLGITHQAVGQWRICPPRRVLEVERATGISRFDLRPDIYPPPVRRLKAAFVGEAQP